MYAPLFASPTEHQVLVYSTLAATFLCGECPFLRLVRRPLEPRPCLATCLAEDILVVVKKVLDISRIVLRLQGKQWLHTGNTSSLNMQTQQSFGR